MSNPETDPKPLLRLTGYHNLPQKIIQAVRRGEIFYIAAELYLPTQDDIWGEPQNAIFRFSDSKFTWQGLSYQNNIRSIPELTKYIGKQFNSLSLELMNVERGTKSGSHLVFKNVIRGCRIGMRMIFPELGTQYSRLIWWGRVVKVQDITEQTVKVNCSQEIGNFSYEIATEKYGAACPLFFGKGECLGTETLEQKSLLFRTAFSLFGQGGCNRTSARCNQLGNARFYQGQNIVTITGQFIRTTVEKVGWWIFKRKKTTNTAVPYSSKNQSENDDVSIGLIFGRTQVELHPITWADIGTQILALMGACKGQILGFYNIICRNPKLTIANVTQHLGELGGVGSQQPDPRFPQSGYNSKLAYLGITFNGSPAEDEPEEVPATTAVIKGMIIKVRDKFGRLRDEWSYNPVWIVRFLMTNFPYTVVKSEWFNDVKNQDTADYCFTVIEDDTEAQMPVITGSSQQNFQDGLFERFRETGRFDSRQLNLTSPPESRLSLIGQNVPSRPSGTNTANSIDPDQIIEGHPDIIWGNGLDFGNANVPNRTYLQYRYTANGRILESSKLSDVLYSLVLPTFRGFFRFNHYGQIEIDCRKPADNTFVRVNTDEIVITPEERENIAKNPSLFHIASSEIGVASVVKFTKTYGQALIGVGLASVELCKIKGIRYVNGCANTAVEVTADNMNVTVSPNFIPRVSAPAEIYMEFAGDVVAGSQIKLTFSEPNGDVLSWDYFVDSDADTLATITKMFQVRLMASLAFRETWTAEIFDGFPYKIYIRCQTGYLKLDRPLRNRHFIGEEIIRVIEVYEDGKDEVEIAEDNSTSVGQIVPSIRKDNLKDFTLNSNNDDTYHGVTGTYISAVQDYRVTQIQPRIAWDAAEQERNLNLLELDLRFVDNYRQAAFLVKSATIQFVDGNLTANFTTGIQAIFHEEGEVIAIRHQTMEGISYTPFTIENISYDHSTQSVKLVVRLYLSAAFDERVAKEEKFLESTLTTNTEPTVTPSPSVSAGGYSSTGTGDGAGDIRHNIRYETQPYKVFPSLQRYSPHGRDLL